MTPAEAALAVLAGAGAGAVNAVAGGGSLISFSALLALGHPPVTANVTTAVGVLPGYAGGSLGYRRELRGQGRRAAPLAVSAAAGALAGAVLLVATPAAAFEAVAPALILLSCALLALGPRLAGLRARRGSGGGRRLHAAQLAAGAYGGYFSAGFGVLLLALLGTLLAGEDLQRLNALKGVLSLVVGAVAAALFALLGPVAWDAAALLAVGALAGGYAGVGLARRLAPGVLRWSVVVVGTAAAVALMAS